MRRNGNGSDWTAARFGSYQQEVGQLAGINHQGDQNGDSSNLAETQDGSYRPCFGQLAAIAVLVALDRADILEVRLGNCQGVIVHAGATCDTRETGERPKRLKTAFPARRGRTE